jgi:hypothetical protein
MIYFIESSNQHKAPFLSQEEQGSLAKQLINLSVYFSPGTFLNKQ